MQARVEKGITFKRIAERRPLYKLINGMHNSGDSASRSHPCENHVMGRQTQQQAAYECGSAVEGQGRHGPTTMSAPYQAAWHLESMEVDITSPMAV